MAANCEFSVTATDLNPLGSFVSLSPCEFHTCSFSGRFANNGQKLSVTRSVPLPYSRFSPFSTLPPRKWPSNCSPKHTPSTGRPRLKTALSGSGAFFEYTLEGPPDRIIPLGRNASISFAGGSARQL